MTKIDATEAAAIGAAAGALVATITAAVGFDAQYAGMAAVVATGAATAFVNWLRHRAGAVD